MNNEQLCCNDYQYYIKKEQIMTKFPISNQRLYRGSEIVDKENEPHTIIGYNKDGTLIAEDCNGCLKKHDDLYYDDCPQKKRVLYITRHKVPKCYDGEEEYCHLWDMRPELREGEYISRYACTINEIPISTIETFIGRKIKLGECIKFVEEVPND